MRAPWRLGTYFPGSLPVGLIAGDAVSRVKALKRLELTGKVKDDAAATCERPEGQPQQHQPQRPAVAADLVQTTASALPLR